MKKLTLAVIAITSMAGASTAFAGDTGWYVFGAAGQTFNDNSKSTMDSWVSSIGGTGFSSSLSKGTVYNLDIGYQVDKNFAFEGGYIGSSNETYTASGGNLGMFSGSAISANVSGWNVKAVGILPVANQFSLLGKLGVSDIKETTSFTIPGLGTYSGNGSKTGVTYGIGAKYDFTEALAGRLDLDRYDIGDSTASSYVSVWTVGVAYKF